VVVLSERGWGVQGKVQSGAIGHLFLFIVQKTILILTGKNYLEGTRILESKF
jgi:hypothetical protein